MKYKLNQYVDTPDGVGQVIRINEDSAYLNPYTVQVLEPKMEVNCYEESQLSPAPKEWKWLNVGDEIENENGKRAVVLARVDDCFLKSMIFDKRVIGGWYTLAETQKRGWKIVGAQETDDKEAWVKKKVKLSSREK